MGAHNPYQPDVNAEGFVEKLKRSDPEDPAAWSIMLGYVQFQVAHEVRSRPSHQDRVAAVEDYTLDVLFIIQSSLGQFEQRGPFSAWIDALLRHAIADQNLKKTLQAVGRFLDASGQLGKPDRLMLHAIIQRIEWPERDLLLAAIGMADDASNIWRQHLWYSARYRLITNPQFQQLLSTLAHNGMRQATTLLNWYIAWKGEVRLSDLQTNDDMNEPPKILLADPNPPPLELLIEQEMFLKLNECLSQLEERSPKQARAIRRRFLYQESDEQIAHSLSPIHPATIRQWIRRGLDSLRKCISAKLQDEP